MAKDMKKKYPELKRRMKEAQAIGAASGLAGWDQETMMPPKAAGSRAEQLAALAGVYHEKTTEPAIGRLLRKLTKDGKGLGSGERACVREWMRDYRRATKLPVDLVRELAKVTSLAQDAWIKARRASDFGSFAPWLKRVVALKRREAKCLGYKGHPYDALLDAYEPEMTVEMLDPIIEGLREGLVPIVAALLGARKKPDSRVLTRRYPEALQEELCREVMGIMGVDREASRLDRSAHPFCCGMAPTDVRITTRFNERWLPQALYGVMHESGHALYEQGLPMKQHGTPLAEAVSLGVHESQSRLWENMIGRSLPFVKFIHPRLKKRFPAQLAGVGPRELFRALGRVEATPIRVESDEVTYNLHIVLRYDLEKALLVGDIGVRDLPGLWNDRMKELLGITPKDDAHGVLQDTHWAQGLIGYFPTYLLGNLNAAQLWHRIRRDVPAVDSKIAKGSLGPILKWLRERVHRHGRRFPPAELIRRATGRPLSPGYFIEYLKGKYGEIYDISSWGPARG